ncbi:hypothetical protein QFC22_005919 [Naganishia vaughanmartiniae]|uniref:Uncharacterized protein n=1 Tax=Naganishia vaughanmartiniae TaxID=1424756 RepID=A0ACC2WR95_9TREE|nr:hypothetical protein QFC22_005919 [Naganishia vaughanmartiniae]
MTVATPKPATQPPPTAQPPSLASLLAMHQSTVTTLVDLFNLAVTHPSGSSGASASGELEQARERIRQLEVELATSKAHEARDVVGRKAEQVIAVEPQFVAVLLDGDGAIASHEAAKLLLSSLPAFIASTGPPEVAKHATRLAKNAVVNVIVNKFGLAGAVVKAGIVSSFSTVADFFLAFSQAHSNINGSHDAGYGNVLRSLVTEGRNVVLLRGGHTAWLLEGICPAGEIEGLFMPGKVPTLSGVGGAVGTGMPSPAPLGGAGRPVMVHGRKTEEARLQEIESARDKKRMRRRLRRQEERERKEAEEHERNDKALQDDSDSDDDDDEKDEDSARAPQEEDTDDVWQDTDGSVAADGEVDDPADFLAKQFASVRIRNPQEYRMMAKSSSSLATPSKTPAQGRSVTVTDIKARATQEGVQSTRKKLTQRKVESESDSSSSSDDDDDDDDQPISRPTPKQPNKTPQQAIPRPKPQTWEALVNTPSGKPGGGGGGKGKQTPRAAIGMTPKTPGRYAANADRGEENSIPVQGAERALRYLNPRPCHK